MTHSERDAPITDRSRRLQLRPRRKFAPIAGKTGKFFRIFCFRFARDFSRICPERFPALG